MEITSYLLGKKAGGGGGSTHDWSAIGYDSEPQNITRDYNYAKSIYDNWDNTQTNLADKFSSNKNLVYMPMVDTLQATNINRMFNSCTELEEMPLLDFSNVTNANDTFYNCQKLEKIPSFNFSKCQSMQNIFSSCIGLKDVGEIRIWSNTNMRNAFGTCKNLTDTSLDNILKMCIQGVDVYTKTFKNLGFNSTDYPASRIEALPHYQDFIDAGWTIGY